MQKRAACLRQSVSSCLEINVANIEALCSQKLSRCLICPDSNIMYDKWTSLCAYLGRTVSKSVCF